MSSDGNISPLDTSNENECNWLSLVQPALGSEDQNCMVFQLADQIYFSTTREVTTGEPLRAWYAKGFARKLGKPETPPILSPPIVEQTVEQVDVSDVDQQTNCIDISEQGVYHLSIELGVRTYIPHSICLFLIGVLYLFITLD